MEVKEPSAKYLAQPGYKQTEVGLIPKDWLNAQLQQIVDDDSPICYGIVQVGRFTPNGIPVLAIKNLNLDYDSNIHRASTEVERPYARSRIRPDDVLVSVKGTTGRVGIIPNYFWGNISRDLARIRPRAEIAPRFIYQVLQSELAQRRLANAAVGTTRMELSIAILKQVCIPLPATKVEQEAIAEVLSDADTLVESLVQLLAKKCQLKQGVIQELFTGKRRLPGFSGKWEVKRLGDIASIRSGGTPSTTQPQFWDGNVLWCTPTDITALNGYKYLNNTSRTISRQGLKASSAEIIPANSITMTSRATIGECAINKVPVTTNQGFKNFVPYEAIDVEFLYYLLLTQKQGFISLCGGSTFLEIGKGQLAAYEVRLPAPKSEQTAIATILSDIDEEIALLEAKLAKARRLKQSMMQELLTGGIRLVRPEINVVQLTAKNGAIPVPSKSHNWQINEAVVISVLTKKFGSEQWPLGRKRYTKLSYLLHRHVEKQAEGYLKKAAGPYNPATKYKGPEGIALKKGYVRRHSRDKFSGFIAADKIGEAESYFTKWYGDEPLAWLEQFRLKTNDELELLATVDMAMIDLLKANKAEQLANVKRVIRDHPEWEAKLDRAIFSDDNISRAMKSRRQLFGSEE